MKKKEVIICIVVILGFGFTLTAQVGIGTTTPDTSAALEINSSNSGLLIPRMNTTDRVAIVSPAQGLLVYDTDFGSFYFYDGSVWKPLGAQSSSDVGYIAAFENTTLSPEWLLLDGTTVLVANYPELAAVYPAWVSGGNINLPDYRGLFLAGAGNNSSTVFTTATPSSPGVYVMDATALPQNTNFTPSSTNGEHTHAGVANTSGSHSHFYFDLGSVPYHAPSGGGAFPARNINTTRFTNAAGSHDHTITNISTVSGHSHTIDASSDSETRPHNISVQWVVKAK